MNAFRFHKYRKKRTWGLRTSEKSGNGLTNQEIKLKITFPHLLVVQGKCIRGRPSKTPGFRLPRAENGAAGLI